MSAEASDPAAAAAASLEAAKPSGLEPGAAAACGLKPLTPNSKYVKLNVGGSLHYTTLRTLTGQDTMLKAMFSGRVEVLTDAGGTRRPCTRVPAPCGLGSASWLSQARLLPPLHPVFSLLLHSQFPSSSPLPPAVTSSFGTPNSSRHCGEWFNLSPHNPLTDSPTLLPSGQKT